MVHFQTNHNYCLTMTQITKELSEMLNYLQFEHAKNAMPFATQMNDGPNIENAIHSK